MLTYQELQVMSVMSEALFYFQIGLIGMVYLRSWF